MRKIFLSIIVLVLLLPANGYSKGKDNLCTLLTAHGQKPAKTYISEIKDSSGKASAILFSLRKELIDALEERMTITFVIVSEEKKANLIISCDILEVKETPTLTFLKADFAVSQGKDKSIFMKASRFLKKRQVLWKEKVTVKGKRGDPKLEEALVKAFIKKCFSQNSRIIG